MKFTPESPSAPTAPGTFSRRSWLLRALPAAGSLLLLSAPADAFNWKVVNSGGRDYVRVRDLKEFYQFASYQREGRNLFLRSQRMVVKMAVGSDDIYINNVKFCLSFPIITQGNEALVSRVDLAKLLDPIIRPRYQRAKPFNTVVIDPGHGGHDSGAVGRYGAEKHYALDTALRLEKRLQALGFKTVLTRRTDVFIERSARVALANRTPNSIFISIHYNSYNASSVGFETFALAPQGTATTDAELKSTDMSTRRGNSRDAENIALATAVHSHALHRLRSVDRGVKRARYDVIAGIVNPGILVEGGFLSNPAECARVHRPEFRQTLAEAIAEGVVKYRNAVTRRYMNPASASN